MPIPELNENGLLPVGIHDCTLEEIGTRFGRVQSSDCRIHLFKKLRDLVALEVMAGLAIALIIDGSFVTRKPEPGDIDLLIVLPPDYNRAGDLLPVQYNATSKVSLRRSYQFDVFIARESTDNYLERIDFFQQVKGQDLRKGLLRITI